MILGRICGRIVDQINLATYLRVPKRFRIEDIPVFDPYPNKYVNFVTPSLAHIFDGYLLVSGSRGRASPEDHRSGAVNWLETQVISLSGRRLFNVNPTFHVGGRCYTDIFEVRKDDVFTDCSVDRICASRKPLCRNVCAQLTFGGLVKLPSHISGGGPKLIRVIGETAGNKHQEAGEYRGEQCADGKPPIARRFFVALLSVLLGFLLSLYGWKNINDKRRLRGASIVFCGALLASSGLLLLWLTGFRWSWQWWL